MILIGIGANLEGPWGTAHESLIRSICELNNQRLYVVKTSRVYSTSPVGGGQGRYVNAVVSLATHLPPLALLSRLKQVEREAGRRAGRRWSARPLDLDILAYHDIIRGWRAPALRPVSAVPAPCIVPAGSLILPHPQLHVRPFVIRPLLDIAPDWHHPVCGNTVSQMWRRVKSVAHGRIVADLGPLRATQQNALPISGKSGA